MLRACQCAESVKGGGLHVLCCNNTLLGPAAEFSFFIDFLHPIISEVQFKMRNAAHIFIVVYITNYIFIYYIHIHRSVMSLADKGGILNRTSNFIYGKKLATSQ